MAFYPCTITLWKAMPQILPTDGGTWKAGWGGICRGRFLKSRISANAGMGKKKGRIRGSAVWVLLLGAAWQGPASCLIVALPAGAGAWDERREQHRSGVDGPTGFLVVDLISAQEVPIADLRLVLRSRPYVLRRTERP